MNTTPTKDRTNNTTAPKPRTKKPRQSDTEHIYYQDEGTWAATVGVELRAFCGVWITPPQASEIAAICEEGLSATCKNCLRIYNARREAGVCR